MILDSQITFDLTNITGLAVIIMVVGYSVVFVALASLVFVIGRIASAQRFFIRLKVASAGKRRPGPAAEPPPVSINADENAAICTALYLYFTELHDEEKYVMTVKKVSRTYSPWSSKIYGVMNLSKR